MAEKPHKDKVYPYKTTSYNKRLVGSRYEDVAIKYLVSKGHTIIKKNYRTSYGEIDIISKDKSTLVFTECKYRSSEIYGSPIEAVDIRKQRKISHVALYFCTKYGYTSCPCRFDVIGIKKDGAIIHIKNAFEYIN